MARRKVQVQDRMLTVSMLEPPPVGHRPCALLQVTLLDELTGRPPLSSFTARLMTPPAADASIRVVHEGLLGVAGRPERAFAPQLATIGVIELEIEAARFARRRLAVRFACARRALASAATSAVITLNSNAGLEPGQRLLLGSLDGSRAEFGVIAAIGPGANQVTLQQAVNFPYPAGSPVQPLPADQLLALRRKPVTIVGRVLKRTGAVTAPLAGATVRVSKIWRQIPPAGTTVDPELPVPGGPAPAGPWDVPIAALWPAAYADIPGTGSIRIEDRSVDGATSPKTLLDDVAAGSTALRLSNAVGLGVTDVIAVDADDAGRREVFAIRSITPSGSASDWSRVVVNQPLAFDHKRNRLVRRLLGPAAGAPVALNYAVARGDEAVLFDASGTTGSHQVRVFDPGPPLVQSFHRIDVLATTTDADGLYRLPPITRAGKIELLAKDSSSPASKAIEFVPDYAMFENRVDVTVS
ncbi:hypothetical protein [Bradyrhizobium liaoningense]|uniref:hypothetical protein n=1 Tax=Bradyrhizobium liaoningense TaxID=43992 RepID=UPI001BAAB8C2|nr:hypothetical protein [Bradyrhizobium liaoningense]MBR0820212.1 hypothetical protein [Bradyrhizobium liaoningense]